MSVKIDKTTEELISDIENAETDKWLDLISISGIGLIEFINEIFDDIEDDIDECDNLFSLYHELNNELELLLKKSQDGKGLLDKDFMHFTFALTYIYTRISNNNELVSRAIEYQIQPKFDIAFMLPPNISLDMVAGSLNIGAPHPGFIVQNNYNNWAHSDLKNTFLHPWRFSTIKKKN